MATIGASMKTCVSIPSGAPGPIGFGFGPDAATVAADAGAFDLTLWVFGALLALFGFVSSIKATTERLTMSYLQRKKAKRLRKQMALASSLQPALASVAAHG